MFMFMKDEPSDLSWLSIITSDTHLYVDVVGLAGLESRGGNGASVKCWNVIRASSKAAGSWLTSGRDTEKVLLLRNFLF